MGDYGFVSARFYRLGLSSQCGILTSENDCNLVQCPPDTATAPRSSLDAGRVTIDAEQRIEMSRGADDTYKSAAVPGALWSAGETINIHVQGNQGDPPGFSTDLTAPDSASITKPVDFAVVDRTQDLEFEWTGATTGYVQAYTSRTDQVPYVSCRWVAADANRSVPSSLLSRLAPGPISFGVQLMAPPTGVIRGNWVFDTSAAVDVTSIALTLQ